MNRLINLDLGLYAKIASFLDYYEIDNFIKSVGEVPNTFWYFAMVERYLDYIVDTGIQWKEVYIFLLYCDAEKFIQSNGEIILDCGQSIEVEIEIYFKGFDYLFSRDLVKLDDSLDLKYLIDSFMKNSTLETIRKIYKYFDYDFFEYLSHDKIESLFSRTDVIKELLDPKLNILDEEGLYFMDIIISKYLMDHPSLYKNNPKLFDVVFRYLYPLSVNKIRLYDIGSYLTSLIKNGIHIDMDILRMVDNPSQDDIDIVIKSINGELKKIDMPYIKTNLKTNLKTLADTIKTFY